MAQWIPKTAWRVSNLNKRYGQQYVVRGAIGSEEPEHYLASYGLVMNQQHGSHEKLLKSLRKTMYGENNNKSVKDANSPLVATCLIDVRDFTERQQKPLSTSMVVPLHPHDILSGAANPILPSNKRDSELFVISSSTQRGVNALAALRRWGYTRTAILDYKAAATLLEELMQAGGEPQHEKKMPQEKGKTKPN